MTVGDRRHAVHRVFLLGWGQPGRGTGAHEAAELDAVGEHKVISLRYLRFDRDRGAGVLRSAVGERRVVAASARQGLDGLLERAGENRLLVVADQELRI